jgi:hypothetical protein
MLSESYIRSLLAHLPSDCDINDRVIIEERLRNFVYNPSYESQYYTHNEKRSIEDSTFFQALAQIGEYSKGYIEANEI